MLQYGKYENDFNSHISMRCDKEGLNEIQRNGYFNSHISMRCDTSNDVTKEQKDISTHTSL